MGPSRPNASRGTRGPVRPIAVLAAISTIACAAVVALWARSYRVTDAAVFRERDVAWWVVSERGRVRIDNEPQVRADAAASERRLAEMRLALMTSFAGLEADFDREQAVDRALRRLRDVLRAALPVRLSFARPSGWWASRAWFDLSDALDAARDAALDAVDAVLDALNAGSRAAERRRSERHISLLNQMVPLFGAPPTRSVVRADVGHRTLAAAAAVPPTVWLVVGLAGRVRRRRRRAAGRCLDCGYDLRGSAVRCPECGAGPKGVP